MSETRGNLQILLEECIQLEDDAIEKSAELKANEVRRIAKREAAASKIHDHAMKTLAKRKRLSWPPSSSSAAQSSQAASDEKQAASARKQNGSESDSDDDPSDPSDPSETSETEKPKSRNKHQLMQAILTESKTNQKKTSNALLSMVKEMRKTNSLLERLANKRFLFIRWTDTLRHWDSPFERACCSHACKYEC